MMRTLPIAASLALLFMASAVNAQTPSTSASPGPAAGDVARGQGLTYTCRGCHGLTGYKNAYPSYHVPKIGSQSETYLRNALTEYRSGKRKHPTMQAQAENFSDQDIADIAIYLSNLK